MATIITSGDDLKSSAASVRLAEQYAGVYATVGFHPHEAATFRPEHLEQLREWCGHPKVVAVGEIGLDFYYDRSPRDVQRRVFEAQLVLAVEVGLPVVIHSRDADAQMEEMLSAWVAQEAPPSLGTGREAAGLGKGAGGLGRGMMHCFSGDAALAARFVDLGFCISLAGPLTFASPRDLHNVARAVPLEALLVETDCPYLTPHPYRGQRNEPARVVVTAQRIADLRGIDLETLAEATTANAIRLFGLPARKT